MNVCYRSIIKRSNHINNVDLIIFIGDIKESGLLIKFFHTDFFFVSAIYLFFFDINDFLCIRNGRNGVILVGFVDGVLLHHNSIWRHFLSITGFAARALVQRFRAVGGCGGADEVFLA